MKGMNRSAIQKALVISLVVFSLGTIVSYVGTHWNDATPDEFVKQVVRDLWVIVILGCGAAYSYLGLGRTVTDTPNGSKPPGT